MYEKRVKIYVNGVRQDVTFLTTVTQNHQTQVNNATEHRIGRWLGNQDIYLHAYLADYYLIDGQALPPETFGKDFDGKWGPLDSSKVIENIGITPAVETDEITDVSTVLSPTYSSNLLSGDSTNTIQDRANAFDGSTATEAVNQGTADIDSNDFLVTFTPAITVNSSFKFYKTIWPF